MQKHYGRWTVLGEGTSTKHHKRRVIVQCTCGTVREVILSNLRRGISKSCGCWNREQISRRSKTHGETQGQRTTEYNTWATMLNRCRNPDTPRYADYGGRGIRVCRRWYKYENFLADMGRKPAGTSLERRNNDGDYTPTNCYWATPAQQAANTRGNRWLTYKGITLHLAAWARRLKISEASLRERLDRNWSPEDVFSSKKHNGRSRTTKKGKP